MKLTRMMRFAGAAIFVAGIAVNAAFGATDSGTTTLSVTVAPEASITISTATTNLTNTGTNFADYTGTTNFSYKLRTTQSGGTGSIVVKITSDFAAGGPSVANSGTTGDTLTYTCTTASGTACSSGTASTSATTNVATFGADAHSAKAGDAGSIAWTLVNDPQYKTGTYTATATVTITAL